MLVLAAIALAAAPARAQKVQLNGAGATFPNPIYQKWFSEYNKLHPEIEINYQSIGSGGGIRQVINQTVFFGATDGPMTDEQLQSAPGKVLHFPSVLGGDVPVYNIPGVEAELKFTGPVLADIFLGKITKWNDAAIAKLNPGVKLPGTDITVCHRSDGIGGKGNEGVAGLVKQTPGSIGYVELIYALQNKIDYGTVQNMAGEFVRATTESVSAAAGAAAKQMPADFRVSITNAPGNGVYPISSFTWLLFFENPKDKQRARIMVDFMKWALADGQKFASELGYAPLPKEVVALEMDALKKIKI
jgi:phosphate transport system substrate-binding protein